MNADEPERQDMCNNCGRRIEWVDGVGWLHPDTRIYWVSAVEPKCANAEPATRNRV